MNLPGNYWNVMGCRVNEIALFENIDAILKDFSRFEIVK